MSGIRVLMAAAAVGWRGSRISSSADGGLWPEGCRRQIAGGTGGSRHQR